MDSIQESIIKYSNEILDYLLKFRKHNPEFTFSLRQRDSAQTKEVKRLESGQWFQGSNYIYVPLFKKGDNARKIKTIGFSIDFDKLGNIKNSFIEISFKAGIVNENEIYFHRLLASKIGLELNENNHGEKSFENPKDIFSNLNFFITEVRNQALALLDEFGLREEYVINEADFQKNLSRIENIKLNSLNKKNEINYWVFQGNPKVFDFETALRKEILTDWTVSSHKDKIKTGDKVILWISGSKAGCYALAEITSEPHLKVSSPDDHLWKEEVKSDFKTDLKITHNLINNPILKNIVDSIDDLKNLKVGSQGTNFSAKKEEYETLLDLSSSNSSGVYAAIKKVLDPEKLSSYIKILRDFVKTNTILSTDERISFNVRKNRNRLVFIIGSRYALNIEKKNNKTEISFISNSVFSEKSGDFTNQKGEIEAHWNTIEKIEGFENHIKDGFQSELERLNKCPFRKYTNQDFINDIYQNESSMEKEKTKSTFPLNQILYGPPGTGKTYNTVLEAAKIVTCNEAISYDEALKIFNDNLGNQIEFITFHQNYSYEDFIQGIRPDTKNEKELTFEKKDGVFKRIADRALKNLTDSEKPESAKKDFDVVFQEFISSLNEDEEIEVKMKQTSFYITQISEKSIEFRKNQGDSQHTLSINTLRKMYNDGINEIILGGLQPYYNPILKILLENGKSQLKPVEKKNFVIIIDEINRANISRVFGELITLIEEDKRSHGAIPMRVTLPSGDPFIVPSNLYIIGTMNTADKSIALLDIALRRRFDFVPMYPLYEGLEKPIYDAELLQKINEAILSRKNNDFTIGHAYFMGNEYLLENTLNRKVIPLLLEYFMNDEKEVTTILQMSGIKIGGWPLKMIL